VTAGRVAATGDGRHIVLVRPDTVQVMDARFLDDLAKLASGAFGTAAGMREEMDAMVRHRFERWLKDMDVPSRDEVEATRAIAAEARRRQEEMEARIVALEANVATLLAERELSADRPGPKRPARKSGDSD
jgi:BMFP domain-containing protein YqiC